MNGKEREVVAGRLGQGAADLGISLDEAAIQKLTLYCQELLKWNKKVNLVAKNTPIEDIVEKHFLDSLTLLPVLSAHAQPSDHLLDVGSGAGFPGLVIKTVCPQRPVTLLEPRQRRVSFLNHVIRTLQLEKIEVCPQRTDELDVSCPQYGLITGRAVADVPAFLHMVRELAAPGTLVACMQGASGSRQWAGKVDHLYTRLAMEHILLPFSRADRFILLFRKIS